MQGDSFPPHPPKGRAGEIYWDEMSLGLIRLPERFVWKHQVFDIIRARLIDGDSWVSTIAIFIAGEVSS